MNQNKNVISSNLCYLTLIYLFFYSSRWQLVKYDNLCIVYFRKASFQDVYEQISILRPHCNFSISLILFNLNIFFFISIILNFFDKVLSKCLALLPYELLLRENIACLENISRQKLKDGGCINYRTFVQLLIIIKQMFSSGTKAQALKHQTKIVTHRIACDSQNVVSANKNWTRGNRLIDSPSKNGHQGQSRSKSRQKKLSANKLFAKAHQACDGETYLTHSKSAEGSHAQPVRLSAGHHSDCAHPKKQKLLEMCQQFNIKIGGQNDNHTLSLIIGMYDFCEFGIEDLSSIQQNTDDSTLTSQSASLIELIVKS